MHALAEARRADAGEEEDAEEQEERQYEIHDGAREDHNHARAHRFLAVTAAACIVLLGVHAGDVVETAERDRADGVHRLTALEAHELRPKADGKLVDAHARHLRRDEVAELMHEDEQAEDKDSCCYCQYHCFTILLSCHSESCSESNEDASLREQRGSVCARPLVFLEELLECRLDDAFALHHRLFDDVVDVEEVDGILEEGADGDFVGRIEDARHRAAHLAGLVGKAQTLEGIGVRLLESQVLELPEVESLKSRTLARRVRQGVLDRQLHVGAAELRDDGAVAELDHRVDDALRVDDDLDLVVVDAVEPLRLDDLKALIDERS